MFLIADDDPTDRYVLRKILTLLGYESLEAASLELAAKLIREPRVEITFLDSGFATDTFVSKASLETLNPPPNIILTGYKGVLLSGGILSLSTSGFILSKPFDVYAVKQAIDGIFGL